MASFTAGFGPQVTVADNGAGAVRVTFSPYDFDWELYGDMAVDGSHYLYNQTTETSAAITGKGGTEAGGYYFDIGGTAFPSADWNDDDRVVPTLQAAPNNYNTIALAHAAMAVNDRLMLWYATLAGDTWHRAGNHATYNTTKAVSVIGGLSQQRCGMLWNSIFYNGDLALQVTQAEIRNLTLVGSYTVGYEPTGAGAGVKCKRLISYGGREAFRVYGVIMHDTCEFENCITIQIENSIGFILGNSGGEAVHTARIKAVNCTSFGGKYGFGIYSAGLTLTNCVSALATTADFAMFVSGNPTATFCASTDATADGWGGAGNIINQPIADLAFWHDNDNNIFHVNPRILTSSALYHAGTPVAGIDYDIDGNARDAVNPSIGAHEGTVVAYPGTPPTFTGDYTVVANTLYNRLDIDISGCYIVGAQSIEIYARQGAAPTTADYTYLVGMGDPADAVIHCWLPPGDSVWHIKLLARNAGGVAVHPDTVQAALAQTNTWPAPQRAITGQAWKEWGVDNAGLYDEVSEDNVADGVTYGAEGEYTGNRVDAPEEKVLVGVLYGPQGDGFAGTLASPPAPSWGSAPEPGDGNITLYVSSPSPSTRTYIRYKRSIDGAWSAESEELSRLGSGAIMVAGLDNNVSYVFTGYASALGLMSSWLTPVYAVPRAPAVPTALVGELHSRVFQYKLWSVVSQGEFHEES